MVVWLAGCPARTKGLLHGGRALATGRRAGRGAGRQGPPAVRTADLAGGTAPRRAAVPWVAVSYEGGVGTGSGGSRITVATAARSATSSPRVALVGESRCRAAGPCHDACTKDEAEVVPVAVVVHVVDVHIVVEERDQERDRQDDPMPQPEPEAGDMRCVHTGHVVRAACAGSQDEPTDEQQCHQRDFRPRHLASSENQAKVVSSATFVC